MLPARSIALTRKVCTPSLRRRITFGERQGSQPLLSTWQMKVERASVETNLRVAMRLRVARVADGPAVMRVFGGVLSTGGGGGGGGGGVTGAET